MCPIPSLHLWPLCIDRGPCTSQNEAMPKAVRKPLPDLAGCACAGSNLEKFVQPAVLAVLVDGPMHGYSIVQHLGGLPMFQGHKPDTTGVYRFLKTLEQRGMVTSAWDTSKSGPARKQFSLTQAGRQCLRRWIETLDEYHGQIGQLVEFLRGASTSPSAPRSCCCKKK
jgi:PadR family transcriptional regulator, regulatory protein PadR